MSKRHLFLYTVVIWGHPKGIEEWKHFVLKIYCYCPPNMAWMDFKMKVDINLKSAQARCASETEVIYLKKVNTLRFWLRVPAEGKCPQILTTCKRQMSNALRFFFNRNLRVFGIYFLQVLLIRIWGYLPSADTFHLILRAITVNL